METYNRESALRHLDSFNLADDFKRYKYGHVLRIHVGGTKNQSSTASSLQSRFVNLSHAEARNIVQPACRKFAKVQLALIINCLTPSYNLHQRDMHCISNLLQVPLKSILSIITLLNIFSSGRKVLNIYFLCQSV